MSQITRTTNDLIVNALYLTGELGVGEPPDNFMLTTGLELINEVLDKFSADSIYIPYLTTLNFNLVAGQANYSISDMITDPDINANRIVDLSFANYTVQTDVVEPIVYPLRIIDKATYYNIVRLNNFQARPGYIFLNKQATESIVTIYPEPDQPYPCSIQVKSMLNKLEANDDLTELPPFCYGFLKYAVARKYISIYPSANWPQTNEDEYQEYYSILKNANETDLTIRPSSLLNNTEPYYWTNILAY